MKKLPIFLLAACVSAVMVLFFLPKPTLLEGYDFSTVVRDRKGVLLRVTLTRDEKYRIRVPLDRISARIIENTLLQEDQYFFRHPGINPIAMFRAVHETWIRKSRRMGGSTITMQLARIRFHIDSRSFFGKIRQMGRAIQLERHYSKRDLLEAYLNLAPYGGNIEGIEAASIAWFGKSALDAGIGESLALAVIPQNPVKRSVDREALMAARNALFLRRLQLYPETRDAQAAVALPLQVKPDFPFRAPHMVQAVLSGPRDKTREVTLTLDSGLQTALEQIVSRFVGQYRAYGIHNAAVLVADARDMDVLAMVGSAGFHERGIQGQVNGTLIRRSPGSTLKPFIYALAFDQGLAHPQTLLKDIPRQFGAYNPENFDYEFLGPVKAQDALILSRNIPAIDLANRLQDPTLSEFLGRVGVRLQKPAAWYGLGLSLGGAEIPMLDLVKLYAMLANGGISRELRFERSGSPRQGQRILSQEASFLVLDILGRTPKPEPFASSRMPLAFKTGTSSGYRDAWSVGVLGSYVIAVWVGNFDNTANPALIGKRVAAPLLMAVSDVLAERRTISLPSWRQYPELLNLRKVEVCRVSGMLPTRLCREKETTWFIPGKSPIHQDTLHREVAMDMDTGLRSCKPGERVRFETFEFWPPDLARILRRAGMERKAPPPFGPDCATLADSSLTQPPQITSIRQGLAYVLSAASPKPLPFAAATDPNVRAIWWFVNDAFAGSSKPDALFFWKGRPGRFVIRVVDDRGLSDVREITVVSAPGNMRDQGQNA